MKAIHNLIGMRGRRKGGLSAPPAIQSAPASLVACSGAFLAYLAARAYSSGSIDAHHWALKGFLAWAREQNLSAPAGFTRATGEAYGLDLPRMLLARSSMRTGMESIGTMSPAGVLTTLAGRRSKTAMSSRMKARELA